MLQNTKKKHDNTTGKKECRILITIRENKKRKTFLIRYFIHSHNKPCKYIFFTLISVYFCYAYINVKRLHFKIF